MHLLSAPTGRQLIATGASPWSPEDESQAPTGRQAHQGFTPLAINYRPLGAGM